MSDLKFLGPYIFMGDPLKHPVALCTRCGKCIQLFNKTSRQSWVRTLYDHDRYDSDSLATSNDRYDANSFYDSEISVGREDDDLSKVWSRQISPSNFVLSVDVAKSERFLAYFDEQVDEKLIEENQSRCCTLCFKISDSPCCANGSLIACNSLRLGCSVKKSKLASKPPSHRIAVFENSTLESILQNRDEILIKSAIQTLQDNPNGVVKILTRFFSTKGFLNGDTNNSATAKGCSILNESLVASKKRLDSSHLCVLQDAEDTTKYKFVKISDDSTVTPLSIHSSQTSGASTPTTQLVYDLNGTIYQSLFSISARVYPNLVSQYANPDTHNRSICDEEVPRLLWYDKQGLTIKDLTLFCESTRELDRKSPYQLLLLHGCKLFFEKCNDMLSLMSPVDRQRINSLCVSKHSRVAADSSRLNMIFCQRTLSEYSCIFARIIHSAIYRKLPVMRVVDHALTTTLTSMGARQIKEALKDTSLDPILDAVCELLLSMSLSEGYGIKEFLEPFAVRYASVVENDEEDLIALAEEELSAQLDEDGSFHEDGSMNQRNNFLSVEVLAEAEERLSYERQIGKYNDEDDLLLTEPITQEACDDFPNSSGWNNSVYPGSFSGNKTFVPMSASHVAKVSVVLLKAMKMSLAMAEHISGGLNTQAINEFVKQSVSTAQYSNTGSSTLTPLSSPRSTPMRNEVRYNSPSLSSVSSNTDRAHIPNNPTMLRLLSVFGELQRRYDSHENTNLSFLSKIAHDLKALSMKQAPSAKNQVHEAFDPNGDEALLVQNSLFSWKDWDSFLQFAVNELGDILEDMFSVSVSEKPHRIRDIVGGLLRNDNAMFPVSISGDSYVINLESGNWTELKRKAHEKFEDDAFSYVSRLDALQDLILFMIHVTSSSVLRVPNICLMKLCTSKAKGNTKVVLSKTGECTFEFCGLTTKHSKTTVSVFAPFLFRLIICFFEVLSSPPAGKILREIGGKMQVLATNEHERNIIVHLAKTKLATDFGLRRRLAVIRWDNVTYDDVNTFCVRVGVATLNKKFTALFLKCFNGKKVSMLAMRHLLEEFKVSFIRKSQNGI
jgi:hypothetical protein